MPGQSNDRIEQFFKKVAARADITYHEEDWKKLEARLDAADALKSAGPNKAGKITGTAIIGVLLIATTVWLSATYDLPIAIRGEGVKEAAEQQSVIALAPPKAPESGNGQGSDALSAGDENNVSEEVTPKKSAVFERPAAITTPDQSETAIQRQRDLQAAKDLISNAQADNDGGVADDLRRDIAFGVSPLDVSEEKIEQELVGILPTAVERNKQKAVVELPGAEGEQTREVDAMVEEEHASDQTKHVATPRLSLLLSFAPDFSGTSMEFYSAPGKAYGAALHYHPFARWSISAGVIKNHKVYTGAGEDYNPPKGYWKYYTNGVIPETVDGSCSILEFPIMVQYTLHNSGKHKWLAGLGASSYLMQSESYRYHFGKPNPGAKEGWDSKRSSRFMFNMLNLTIGYERRIVPGLMLGIEPYAKIPLEEIGWSNLRLFSTGASLTLRYTVLQKKTPTLPQGRAPD